MSDKTHPAIFQPNHSDEIKVSVFNQRNGVNSAHLEGLFKGEWVNYFVNDNLKNITREYLTNTYGK